MRALIVARNIGPAKSLAMVVAALLKRGHSVAAVLSKDAQEMVDGFALMNFNPDVVLIATSSVTPQLEHNLEEELDVAYGAMRNHVPFAIFSDTFGTYRRSKITAEHIRECRTIFVVDEEEKRLAEAYGFTHALVSGVPIWETFGGTGSLSGRAEVRSALGIADADIAIVYSCTKTAEINVKTLQEIFQALTELAEKLHDSVPVFLPRFHPGDPNLRENGQFYKFVLETCPVRIVLSLQYPQAEDLLQGADVVISTGSTLGIAAIFQRKYVVEFSPLFWQERLVQEFGVSIWPPASLGAAVVATDPSQLAVCIRDRDTLSKEQRIRQEKHYSVQPGIATARIVAELERLAKCSAE